MASNAEIADKLDEARALIEKGWCQEAFARADDGSVRIETDADAVCYCSGGAIFKVAERGSERKAALAALEKVTGPIIEFNDAFGRTQSEVIDAFKRAAALARGEAA